MLIYDGVFKADSKYFEIDMVVTIKYQGEIFTGRISGFTKKSIKLDISEKYNAQEINLLAEYVEGIEMANI